jgi:uncharacterized protein
MSKMSHLSKPLRKIVRRKSGIHRYGVYAAERILKGANIIRYTGRKLTTVQGNRSKSHYLFILNQRWDILGRNLARYINHSCQPNCDAVIEAGRVIWIVASRNIKVGEELVYDYGYKFDVETLERCLCRSKGCAGYIVQKQDWPKIRRWKNQAGKRARGTGAY